VFGEGHPSSVSRWRAIHLPPQGGKENGRRHAIMIVGLGNDMSEIARVARVLEKYGDRFTHRCFTEIERQKSDRRAARAASYAKRFAAKEACAKALGTGMAWGVYWRDLGVVNLPSGKPTMKLTNGAARALARLVPAGHEPHIHVSITDDGGMAQAFVIIEALPVDPAGALP
jgi:holo-[acyl-carrier protein] synthase